MKLSMIFTSQTELAFNGNANQLLVSAPMPARGMVTAFHLTGTMDATAAVDFPTWLRIGFTNQPRIADLGSALLPASNNIVSVVRRLNSGVTAQQGTQFDIVREFPKGCEPH